MIIGQRTDYIIIIIVSCPRGTETWSTDYKITLSVPQHQILKCYTYFNMFTSYNSPCGMKCCFPGCLSKRKEDTSTTPKSYFSFPKDSSRCTIWLEKCNCRSLMLIDPVILNKK
ncbi:unnamed protein product [Aphis gossypii]|uniref:THAP-type domain-containing protein n=1 Tax=Aphis gossypii TaxID=80765 RepID=A0A9P0J3R7_APHGO|nr:unnamed protein product [Aphis gossypii]